MKLTINKLREEAINFCKYESTITHEDLIGITDGKAVGTYIEHKFDEYLKNKYEVTIGSSAKGIDLPDSHINTDIKVTSVKKPQSSSPFKNIEQKVYGLGHNLLIFVYEKTDVNNKCYLDFRHCIFLEAEKTGDYNLTKILRKMIELGANDEDIVEILKDMNVPGDEQIFENLAKNILSNPPKQGYLTISNAFQWRLKYNNVIHLENDIDGVYTYNENNGKELKKNPNPLFLTDLICEYLKNNLKINPDIIVDPTGITDNFLKSTNKLFPDKQHYGIKKYELNTPIKLINEDTTTFDNDNHDSFLIIGNPCAINNNPFKINSNNVNDQDIIDTESFILEILEKFKSKTSTIAFLCQKTTSRNIFIELIRNNIRYSFIKQINFDSYKLFNHINPNECLFIIQFGGENLTEKTCEVADISNPSKTLRKFGFISERFYSNVDEVPLIDGECKIEWKEGVKHDCAKVMELTYENNKLINKKNEHIRIERMLLYPLLKSSQLKKPVINKTSRYILITQQKIRQDTNYIKTEAPKTWKYLNDNKQYFDKRKSQIYENTPNFSIFGIGDYSFKKYKVAISGFNKTPLFSLVYGEKTFMLDDACYFLPFDEYDDAYITMLILNSALVKKFLNNITFLDSKRPFSKKVLKRIDIEKCLNILIFEDLKEIEKELELNDYITQDKFLEYLNKYK